MVFGWENIERGIEKGITNQEKREDRKTEEIYREITVKFEKGPKRQKGCVIGNY